ncbi:hypothetical protein KGQ29_03870 [Patescibacteria group bacterium]|nr:hypothetical protein [Patescibacteria group bacterium]
MKLTDIDFPSFKAMMARVCREKKVVEVLDFTDCTVLLPAIQLTEEILDISDCTSITENWFCPPRSSKP